MQEPKQPVVSLDGVEQVPEEELNVAFKPNEEANGIIAIVRQVIAPKIVISKINPPSCAVELIIFRYIGCRQYYFRPTYCRCKCYRPCSV